MTESTVDGFCNFFTFADLTYSVNHPGLVSRNRKDAMLYSLAGKRLSKLLGSIRHILGDAPIKVNSGFRNPALNTAVGSKSKASKHLVFEAADIVPTNMSVKKAFEKLIESKENGELGDLRKVLMEGTWLHVEVSMRDGDFRGFFVSKDGNETFGRVA